MDKTEGTTPGSPIFTFDERPMHDEPCLRTNFQAKNVVGSVDLLALSIDEKESEC